MAFIEKIGLEPVPAGQRTSTWRDYFLLQFSFSFNAGNFLLPALAVLQGGLPFWWAVASMVVGNVLAFILVALFSFPGVDYGIPGQFASRMILGVNGSRYVGSLLRAVIAVYWFSVQTVGAAVVVSFMLERLTGVTMNLMWLSFLFAAVMTVLAIAGYKTVQLAVRLIFPVMLLVMIVLLWQFLTTDNTAYQWSSIVAAGEERSLGTFLLYTGLAFAQYVPAITGSSDLCRYARNRRDAFLGLVSGSTTGMAVTASLVAYGAIASGEWNPYLAASPLNDSLLIQLLMLSGVLVSLCAINLNNAYTGGMSLLNTFPATNRMKTTGIFGLVSGGICLYPGIIDHAAVYIHALGGLAIPLAGVLVVDYLIVHRQQIDVEALVRGDGIYQYWHGFNLSAIFAVALAAVYFYTVPDELMPGLSSCLIAGILHLLFTRSSSSAGRIFKKSRVQG
ncbi:purine-cytosine permease family protein [Paenibacillus daejeonensis]|uniref:purine-cytosine permease family protein n=1 Tax=Paenibacillus daejeonensis TaxID=135193 RepID=UPI000360344F|nr:cytosine permease [Paenibacillus daejeonensis]